MRYEIPGGAEIKVGPAFSGPTRLRIYSASAVRRSTNFSRMATYPSSGLADAYGFLAVRWMIGSSVARR